MLANGTPVNGAVQASATSNGYLQADRFHATVALGLDPSLPAAWWAETDDIKIEIQIGFGTAAPQSLFIGHVDQLDIDPICQTVELHGRDLSSLLVDAKTQETFSNQTASQVAKTLAARHGLTASVTATTHLVGSYYEIEHDSITLNNFSRQTTEWDLLTYLAKQEGFDVWVHGNTLYFQPPPTGDGTPFPITFQPGQPPVTNVLTLRMERSLTLAQDIIVTVKSWKTSDGTAYTRSSKAVGTHKASSGKAQNYAVTIPNLTPDQALKQAQQMASDLSKHERILIVSMPGELALTTRNMVSLSGTGTSFDQSYFVAEIEREISFESGFTQRLRLKNSSPRTQTTVV
jgi:phage protein D